MVEEIDKFEWLDLDIRDTAGVDRAFAEHDGEIELVVHAAAQPSHDWAAIRKRTSQSTQTALSTCSRRAESMPPKPPSPTSRPTRSTAIPRTGCRTGPAHAGAKLHGFLAYLMKCAVTGERYTVIGYAGKQVRDNLHAADVASAIAAFHANPAPARVYNLGGGRFSNCSMLEAIEACERITGNEMDIAFDETPRIGDHRWWISDLAEFQADYPDWQPEYDVEAILAEIFEHNRERWATLHA